MVENVRCPLINDTDKTRKMNGRLQKSHFGHYYPSQHGYFGEDLEDIVSREGSTVPTLIQVLCECLYRQNALGYEGVFRRNGSSKTIENARMAINVCQPSQIREIINHSMLTDGDINSAAGLLKLFLRELPNGLITRDVTEDLINVTSQSATGDAVQSRLLDFEKILARLAPVNYATLTFVCRFLHQVHLNAAATKMPAHALGIIFGPCVFKPVRSSLSGNSSYLLETNNEADMQLYNQQNMLNRIMTVLIENTPRLFRSHHQSSSNPPMVKNFANGTLTMSEENNNRTSGGHLLLDQHQSPGAHNQTMMIMMGPTPKPRYSLNNENMKPAPTTLASAYEPNYAGQPKYPTTLMEERNAAPIISHMYPIGVCPAKQQQQQQYNTGSLVGFSTEKASPVANGSAIEHGGLETTVFQQSNPPPSSTRLVTDGCILSRIHQSIDRFAMPRPSQAVTVPRAGLFSPPDQRRFANSQSFSPLSPGDCGPPDHNQHHHHHHHHHQKPQQQHYHPVEELHRNFTNNKNAMMLLNAEEAEDDNLQMGDSGQESSSRSFLEQAFTTIITLLAEKRALAQRPENLEEMTLKQLESEKFALQKALISFEGDYGRPKTREERVIMRPLYNRYKAVKRLITQVTEQQQQPAIAKNMFSSAMMLSNVPSPSATTATTTTSSTNGLGPAAKNEWFGSQRYKSPSESVVVTPTTSNDAIMQQITRKPSLKSFANTGDLVAGSQETLMLFNTLDSNRSHVYPSGGKFNRFDGGSLENPRLSSTTSLTHETNHKRGDKTGFYNGGTYSLQREARVPSRRTASAVGRPSPEQNIRATSSPRKNRSSSAFHHFSLAELRQELDQVADSKRELQKRLKNFEHEVEARTGAKLTSEARASMRTDYDAYRNLKRQLKELEEAVQSREHMLTSQEMRL